MNVIDLIREEVDTIGNFSILEPFTIECELHCSTFFYDHIIKTIKENMILIGTDNRQTVDIGKITKLQMHNNEMVHILVDQPTGYFLKLL